MAFFVIIVTIELRLFTLKLFLVQIKTLAKENVAICRKLRMGRKETAIVWCALVALATPILPSRSSWNETVKIAVTISVSN